MPESKGKHLTLENGKVIENGVRDGLGCRAIARRLHVSPSAVSLVAVGASSSAEQEVGRKTAGSRVGDVAPQCAWIVAPAPA